MSSRKILRMKVTTPFLAALLSRSVALLRMKTAGREVRPSRALSVGSGMAPLRARSRTLFTICTTNGGCENFFPGLAREAALLLAGYTVAP